MDDEGRLELSLYAKTVQFLAIGHGALYKIISSQRKLPLELNL